MTTIANTAQAAAWNGYEGEHWAAHADRHDAVNSGSNGYVLDLVRPGDRVLDIGCGNGQLTRLAAARARSAAGVDLSGPMLATARTRAAEVPNVTFERGDAQVHPFEEGAFDLAMSRFGVMFFADPVAAFANIRRVLRPGGRLAFLCLTAPAGTDLGEVFDALAEYLPRPTGPDGSGPTSFADLSRTRAVLTVAGFEEVTGTRVEADQSWGRDVRDAAAFMTGWGPVRHHLAQVDEVTAARAAEALTAALERVRAPGRGPPPRHGLADHGKEVMTGRSPRGTTPPSGARKGGHRPARTGRRTRRRRPAEFDLVSGTEGATEDEPHPQRRRPCHRHRMRHRGPTWSRHRNHRRPAPGIDGTGPPPGT